MPGLFALTTSIPYNAFVVALAIGVVVGVYGHVIRSRTLILTGILMIGLISSYFTLQFVLRP